MTKMRFLHRILRNSNQDSGFSLAEMMVGTAMMTVTAGIFMGAVTNLGQDVRKQANVTDALAGNRAIYTVLDKNARYADEIEAPSDGVGTDAAPIAKANGKGYFEYVEFHSSTSDLKSSCMQWRYDSDLGKVQYRLATLVSPATTATIGTWVTVATSVANNIKDYTDSSKFQPVFTVPTVSSTSSQSLQQLQIWVVTARGTTNAVGNATTRSTFTAMNSDTDVPTTNQCLAAPYGLDRPTS